MSPSKNRPRWSEITSTTRNTIEQLIGSAVVEADNCPGGYSPGFASLLTRAEGRRVFVKAIDADRWPADARYYRYEAEVAAALPPAVSAPRLLGSIEDGPWVILAFDAVDGINPSQPWRETDLNRVATAVVQLGKAATPSPIPLTRDHPRLGGWQEVASNPSYLSNLAKHSAWAVDHIDELVRLEVDSLEAAEGDSLVHFDLSPHNILLTPDQVMFVDWPHARLGASVIDLVIVLSSAPVNDIDLDSILRNHSAEAAAEPSAVDAILAAHAGCLVRGGVSPKPRGLEAIAEIDLHLGLAALSWLRQRRSTRK